MKLKNFYRVVIVALMVSVLFSSCAFAARKGGLNHVHGGVLNYLGTTEDEFQNALDELTAMLPAFSLSMFDVPENQDFVTMLTAIKENRHVIHFYDNLTSMLMALEAGRVDEISLPESTAKYIMKSDPEYRILFTIRMPSAISCGFRAEDKELCAEFSKAIASMKEDGTLKALEEKYINAENISEAAAFEKFEDAGKITVAVTGDMPPMDFVASDGKPAGYNTAVLSEIGKRLKKNIEIISVEAGARSSALTSGRADVIFWYRSTKGMTFPKEIEIKGENPVNAVMKDANEGVILSEPYYEWQRTLIITK